MKFRVEDNILESLPEDKKREIECKRQAFNEKIEDIILARKIFIANFCCSILSVGYIWYCGNLNLNVILVAIIWNLIFFAAVVFNVNKGIKMVLEPIAIDNHNKDVRTALEIPESVIKSFLIEKEAKKLVLFAEDGQSTDINISSYYFKGILEAPTLVVYTDRVELALPCEYMERVRNNEMLV